MLSSGGSYEAVKIIAGCIISIWLCDYFVLGGDISASIVQLAQNLF